MDPQGRLTCAELLAHPYFDMYDKMMDSMKDEHKPKPRRSHGNRDKNNSRTTVSFTFVDIHSTSLFFIPHTMYIVQAMTSQKFKRVSCFKDARRTYLE